jgi:uncharacterized membrane protein YgcG
VSGLDPLEADMERECDSWRAPGTNVRKANLLIVMVAPESHKMGTYYGAAFDKALADHWLRIQHDSMGPYFKQKAWADGLVVGAQDLKARIIASRDEALHPQQNTTNVAATDMSGLWTTLKWALVIATAFALFFIFIGWLVKRKRDEDEWAEARNDAIEAKARVVAILKDHRGTENEDINDAAREFSRLSNSVRNDPADEDLEISEYNRIQKEFERIENQIHGHAAVEALKDSEFKDEVAAKMKVEQGKETVHARAAGRMRTPANTGHHTGYESIPVDETQPTSVQTYSTYPYVLPVPIVIPDPTPAPTYAPYVPPPETRHRYEEEKPSSSSSSRSRDNDDDKSSGGGGSFSFGSDSGSSGGGSDSSFGSDSGSGGGGGSSDF